MADKYMEALDHGSEFLAHYGIKGMKWDPSKKKSQAELRKELFEKAAGQARKRLKDFKDSLKESNDEKYKELKDLRERREVFGSDRTSIGRIRNKTMDALLQERHNQKTKNSQMQAPSSHETGVIKKLNVAFNKYANDQAHQRMALADKEARKRRIADAEAVDRKKKQLEEDHKQRLEANKKLKEEARKKHRSDFDQYVDSRLKRRRKDNIRRALAKAAKQTKYR